MDGDESASRDSGSLLSRFEDRFAERREELDARESERCKSCDFLVKALTNVAWLDDRDLSLTRDFSSRSEAAREIPEALDLGLGGSSSTLSSPSRFLSAERSVSGGVGGREDFLDAEGSAVRSADFDRSFFFSSSPPVPPPISVVSGVKGIDERRLEDTSSRLTTASLLCALLKEG